MPKPKPAPKPIELPKPDGLRVVLRPAGGITCITEHGLEVHLSADAAGMIQLVRMLQIQADTHKTVRLTGDQLPLVLAAWQRIGPTGAGKIEKPPLGAGPRPNEYRPNARRFTATGRPLPSLDDLLNA